MLNAGSMSAGHLAGMPWLQEGHAEQHLVGFAELAVCDVDAEYGNSPR